MKINVNDIFTKQGEWQKSRKTLTWGDKISQAENARDSLSGYGYRSGKSRCVWSVRENTKGS